MKTNIPLNFIKLPTKVNNQRSHKLPHKPLVYRLLELHKVLLPKYTQQTSQIIIKRHDVKYMSI